MSDLPKVVHPHIEKVGGTTVLSRYRQVYGADGIWGYSSSEGGMFRSLDKKLFDIDSTRQQKVRAWLFRNTPRIARAGQLVLNALPSHVKLDIDEVSSTAKVVMGHFRFDQVADTLDTSSWEYRTVLRNPLDRMVSHYCYLMQRAVPSNRMRIAALTPDVPFEEFALDPRVQNYQLQVVGPSPHEYALIGVMEYLDAFLGEAGLQPRTASAPVINRGTMRADPSLSRSFISAFEEFHARDYELYERVREQWR